MPYSGPLSALATLGRATVAYNQMINDQGRVNGRNIKRFNYFGEIIDAISD